MSSINDNGNNAISFKNDSAPQFDLHALYQGLEKYPVNHSDRNEGAINIGTLLAGREPLTPYRLPEIEVVNPSGQSTLGDLNRRITDKATDNVQKHMTPQEKRQLNEDMVKYGKQMQEYEEHMRGVMMGTGGIGLDDPPPPKPASLIRYEQAIDAEIKKIVRNMV